MILSEFGFAGFIDGWIFTATGWEPGK